MKSHDRNAWLFLGGVCSVSAFAVFLVSEQLIITPETGLVSILWLSGFGFLFFNVAYLFVISIARLFVKAPILKEAPVTEFPEIALLYPIRNERHGLYERMDYSLSANMLPALDFWILSDSDPEYEPFEQELTQMLREKHGAKVFYRRRIAPLEKKQGNMREFLYDHPGYSYIYVADADGMIPPDTILKLLKKAFHPENWDIAIFQCFIRIAHARTWYAKFEQIGARFAQEFNFISIQALFGRSISFGHHQLVRTDPFAKIKLPKGLLSHDNWDTALLDQTGFRAAFCPDVFGFDEAPANYLEARARARRWAQGTLQGWPLVFKKRISLITRFLSFYGIYLYLADIIFFLWVILGLFAHSAVTGELIHLKTDSVWMGRFTNSVLNGTLLFSVAVVFLHKLVVVRNLKALADYFYELFFSSMIMLNNFFYVPLDILTLPLSKFGWKPMAKNPFAKIGFSQAAESLLPGTIFGLLGFYYCTKITPYFVWQATPVLLSLAVSIPAVYFTAKPMSQGFSI